MATSIIGTVKHLPKASVLPSLPEEGISNRIYFVPSKNPTEDNRYSEYLWVKDDDHPEGYWELVGPTAIDLTNYATKEDLNNYLLLTGGNMLDNITFPQEKGIVISGKSDSDLLTATGKSTTLKTINGTTLFGSDNIEIDTSNISVSLEWYKRNSLSEEATINLNIGRSKVNLFPNIFNLFTSGIAHTQTSLYLELSANPGAGSLPQAPTSLCQWKIPLADNNTAGIISSKDKSKLDSLSDPKNLLAYGVDFNSIKFYNAIKKYGWDNFTHEVVYSNLNKQAADKLEKELIHKYNSIEEGYNLKEGGSRGELSTKSLAKMSESLKRGYSEFPERREKIRNKALGRKMPKDTRCKISLNHSKSNLLKINDEVGSIRYWALKIGKAHSVLSYRLKVHGIDNLRKYIEQRIKLV